MSKRIHYEPQMTGEKECKDCKRSLPVIAFAAHSLNKDGLQSHCRECDRQRSKERYREVHMIGEKKTRVAKIRYQLWPEID